MPDLPKREAEPSHSVASYEQDEAIVFNERDRMHPIHPMVVHFPIALLLTSWLSNVLAFRWRGEQFRETSRTLLVLGVLAAAAALLTEHFAEEAIERSGNIPKQAIETHEELAFVVFWFFVGLLGLRLASYRGSAVEKTCTICGEIKPWSRPCRTAVRKWWHV